MMPRCSTDADGGGLRSGRVTVNDDHEGGGHLGTDADGGPAKGGGGGPAEGEGEVEVMGGGGGVFVGGEGEAEVWGDGGIGFAELDVGGAGRAEEKKGREEKEAKFTDGRVHR